MASLWEETVTMPRFPALEGDRQVRVLIIGGGMAGLLCAHMMERAGIDYLLVEAGELCGGITAGTIAKITAQHGLIYDKLISQWGEERARDYLQANRWALAQYRSLCQEIDCDFQPQDNVVYTLEDCKAVKREVYALRRLGAPAKLCSPQLPVPTAGGVCLPEQAQFHPLKFAAALAQGLNIRTHTKVRHLLPGKAVTDHGEIKAAHIIVATHFPMLNKHGGYFLKLYQHRSYVLAVKNAPLPEGMYVDGSGSGLSFRRWGDVLLLGGGGHRTGKQGGGWRELEAFAARHWPHGEIVGRWAAQDCMTLDGIPYIGRYGKGCDNLWVAAGFNKWGMTSAMAAARLLRDGVQGTETPWAEVFSPQRRWLHPQLAVNAFEATVNLLTPVGPRCPHMGCVLKWNRAERTWDCPCHGSRFTPQGQLIDNPATDDKPM